MENFMHVMENNSDMAVLLTRFFQNVDILGLQLWLSFPDMQMYQKYVSKIVFCFEWEAKC